MAIYVYTDEPNIYDGMVGYRPLQTDLLDASGNGKDGEWVGTGGTFTTVGGKTGASCSADSSYSRASRYIRTSLDLKTNPKTFIAWFYATRLVDRGGIMGNTTSAQRGCYVGSNGFDIAYRGGENVDSFYVTSQTVQTNQRYCVGVTVDNGTMKLYKNGQLIDTYNGGIGDSGGNRLLGAGIYSNYRGARHGIEGYIRHCAVYNRILDSNEMNTYYTATS